MKKKCEPFAEVTDATRALIADMFDTMYDAPGIGLAAPQVGVLDRVVVIDCAGRSEDEDGQPIEEPPEPIAFINPEILWASDETRSYNEGCLSIPEQFDDVTRPDRVKIRWLDETGAAQEREFEGVRATCIQHEIDHLDGKLFIDYLGPVKRQMITTKMKKLKRERAKERAKEQAKEQRPSGASS